jgi:hypothetical protein
VAADIGNFLRGRKVEREGVRRGTREMPRGSARPYREAEPPDRLAKAADELISSAPRSRGERRSAGVRRDSRPRLGIDRNAGFRRPCPQKRHECPRDARGGRRQLDFADEWRGAAIGCS